MGSRTVALSLCVLFAGGCIAERSLHREILQSRTRAYQTWLGQAQRQRNPETLISGKLSLMDALKLSLLNNKSLQAIIQEKEVARGELVIAYAQAFPEVTATGNYTKLDKVSSFDVGGGSVSLGSVDTYSVELTVKQSVFRGGAIGAGIRAAKVFAMMADENVRGTVQRLIFDVAKAYYDMLLAQHLYNINLDAVAASKAQLDVVRKKRAQGVAADFDVLRAETELSNFRAELIQQRNRINLARTALLRAIGVSQQSKIALADELQYKPMKPVLEEAVRLAFVNRPELYQAELDVRFHSELLRIAKGKYLPKVDVLLTHGWANPDPHSITRLKWGHQWFTGVTVEMPVFDGFKRRGDTIKSRAELKKAKVKLLDAQEQALFEIQRAILSLHDADEFVDSQKMNLQRATEGLRLAKVGYDAGINTELEVIDARAANTRARSFYYQAVYGHTVARLNLQRAAGILGPRADQGAKPDKIGTPGFIAPFMAPANGKDDK